MRYAPAMAAARLRAPMLPLLLLPLLLLLLDTCTQPVLAAGSLPSRSKLKVARPPPPPPPPPAPPPDGGAGSQLSTYVTFHDSAGTPIQLYKKTWDKIVKDTPLEPMDLEPAEAMQKEREMNQRVSSGEHDESAWHQHQYVMASSGNVDSARILMEYGVAPSLQKMSQDGVASPLQQAALSGSYDDAEQLLENGETGIVLHEMSQQPLVAAAMMGHADIVGLLLREGHDAEVTGANGATALMVAASMGHLLVLDVLIQHGAKLDARHKFAGSTAIHFAAEMGEVAAVKRLCSAGADVESEKTHGGRALHTAADTNQPEVITALLECGAKRNALLMDDTTALYLAAQNGFTEVARALVEHKCESEFCLAQKEAAAIDFEMPSGPESSQVQTKMDGAFGSIKSFFETGNGATALHAACENVRTVHSRCTQKSWHGDTSFSLCSFSVHSHSLWCLLMAVTNNKQGHLGVVKILATNGVDVNSRGMQGVTPLYSCISYNHPDITSCA
jgi:ankyrin repeat protein